MWTLLWRSWPDIARCARSTDADIDTIVRLLPLVHVEFALSEIDYFAGTLADPGQATLAWQTYLIDHADWFLSRPGQDFLQQFAHGALA